MDSFKRRSGGAPLDQRYLMAVHPDWKPYPFAASMSDVAAGFQVCEYARDGAGIVRLRGALKMTGIPANPQLIGTLPINYRPPATHIFAQMGDYAGGNLTFRVDVNVDGTMTVQSASGVAWAGGYISLSSITFSTT